MSRPAKCVVAVLIVTLAIAGVTVSYRASTATTQQVGAQPPIRATIQIDKEVFTHGEPVTVELRIANLGQERRAVSCPTSTKGLAYRSSNLWVSLVSSAAAAYPSKHQQDADHKQAPVELFAGAYWGARLDLANLFGTLPPDTYTAVLHYEVLAKDDQAAAQRGQRLWVGRTRSDAVRFVVVALDQDDIIAHHVLQWKTEVDPGNRLRALLWIEDNALKPGMSQPEVEGLLGKPSRTRAGGNTWVYRVGRTGIIIYFEEGAVASFSPFET